MPPSPSSSRSCRRRPPPAGIIGIFAGDVAPVPLRDALDEGAQRLQSVVDGGAAFVARISTPSPTMMLIPTIISAMIFPVALPPPPPAAAAPVHAVAGAAAAAAAAAVAATTAPRPSPPTPVARRTAITSIAAADARRRTPPGAGGRALKVGKLTRKAVHSSPLPH